MVNPLTAAEALGLDPKMMEEIASGMEEGKDVAARYGFDDAQWEWLAQQKSFVTQIEAMRAENERTGRNIQQKAKIMSDMLLEKVFTEAMDESVPVKDKTVVLQAIARLADIEPKKSDVAVAQGPGFQINISIPLPPKEEAVDAKAVEVEDVEEDGQMLIDFSGGNAS